MVEVAEGLWVGGEHKVRAVAVCEEGPALGEPANRDVGPVELHDRFRVHRAEIESGNIGKGRRCVKGRTMPA